MSRGLILTGSALELATVEGWQVVRLGICPLTPSSSDDHDRVEKVDQNLRLIGILVCHEIQSTSFG